MKKYHNSPIVGFAVCTATRCPFNSMEKENGNSSHLLFSQKDAEEYREIELTVRNGGEFGEGATEDQIKQRSDLFIKGVKEYSRQFNGADLSDEEMITNMKNNDIAVAQKMAGKRQETKPRTKFNSDDYKVGAKGYLNGDEEIEIQRVKHGRYGTIANYTKANGDKGKITFFNGNGKDFISHEKKVD